MLPDPHPQDDDRLDRSDPFDRFDRSDQRHPAPESSGRPAEASVVHIDCDDCAVQGLRCGDCVVPLLLGSTGSVDGAERAALDALADSGLVPRLQLVPLGLPRLRPGAAETDRHQVGHDDGRDATPRAL